MAQKCPFIIILYLLFSYVEVGEKYYKWTWKAHNNLNLVFLSCELHYYITKLLGKSEVSIN